MPLGLGSAVPLLLLSGLVLEIVVILFLSRIPDCVLVWLYLVFPFVRRLELRAVLKSVNGGGRGKRGQH